MRFHLAASSQPVSAQVPKQPIATTGTPIPGTQLQLFTAQRSQPGAVLIVFGLKATSSNPDVSDIYQYLSANENQAHNSVSNVSVLDPGGLKQYETFMGNPSDDSSCLCTIIPDGGPSLSGGQTDYYAALVAAPPSNVKTVSVVTGLGSFANAPLS